MNMKKYLIFGMLFLLVSCKKEREINFDNSSENDTLVNTTLEEKKFDKISYRFGLSNFFSRVDV